MPEPMLAISTVNSGDEKKKSTNLLGHDRESGFDFVRGKRFGAPHELRGIDFRGGENACHHADEHGGEHDVPAGIFDFFGKGGDAVEADVSQDRE